MKENFAEISVKGKILRVPATHINGQAIVITGSWIRTAVVHDEHWQPAGIQDPAGVVGELRRQRMKADLFTFAQKLPETFPKFKYPMEWDNVAVIPITSFIEWWEKSLPQATRKNVRRARKRGVVIRPIAIGDREAQGLKAIYDETPIRQGRKFWHYGKDVGTIKRENSSYLEKSELIGAYFQDELIGFLKMVYIGKAASIMQIISKNRHYDKRPTNALLAKAVEICEQKGMAYFVYGQYVYGDNNDASLTEFKRRNGFQQVLIPRYYIPLTLKGRFALKLKLHLGLRRSLPRRFESALLSLRAKLYERAVIKRLGTENESLGT